MRARGTLLGAAAGLVLAGCFAGGCADSLPSLPKLSKLSPFAKEQQPLPGRRISLMQTPEGPPGEMADSSHPVSLPPQRANDSWAEPGGEANGAPGHLALANAVRQTWSANAGEGSGKNGRVTASPIVFGGRIYTLDADANVTAFSDTGSSEWRVSLIPESEDPGISFFSLNNGPGGGGYGGGLAADNGRLIAASGFGIIAALDPATGRALWQKSLGAPIRAAPTAADNKIFAITSEGRFFCLSGDDGAELWTVRGLPQQASLVGNASPAVEGDIVVVPYPTGDIVALKVADGSTVWTDTLARTRTTSELTSLSNAARPAIDRGTVYAIGHSGRMIAAAVKTGERRWSLNLPGTQTPWVAGDTVFVVDTGGQLLAVTRDQGKIQWTAKLPGGTWSGPTLAGDTLWLASSSGQLVGVDPATGTVRSQQDVGSPVYVPPVVAQNHLYLLTDSAELLAFN